MQFVIAAGGPQDDLLGKHSAPKGSWLWWKAWWRGGVVHRGWIAEAGPRAKGD